MVVFLESPEEKFYETVGNTTRHESFGEALESARKIKEAWKYHPNMEIIESKDNFDEKKRC